MAHDLMTTYDRTADFELIEVEYRGQLFRFFFTDATDLACDLFDSGFGSQTIRRVLDDVEHGRADELPDDAWREEAVDYGTYPAAVWGAPQPAACRCGELEARLASVKLWLAAALFLSAVVVWRAW